MNDFGIIGMKFGNEFWLILFREYISPKLFAVGGDGITLQDLPNIDEIKPMLLLLKPSQWTRGRPC
jgi:hypothetical protein